MLDCGQCEFSWVTNLWCVYRSQRAKVFFDYFIWKLRLSQTHLFHGLAMMSAARIGGLNALAKKVLDTVEHERCVVDCIYLGSCQLLRVLMYLVRSESC